MAVETVPLPEGMDQWIASFRARFPEFGSKVTDEQVAYAIEDAMCVVGDNWIAGCNDCGRAILFLAAHYLTQSIVAGQVLDSGIAGGGESGIIPGGSVTSISFEGERVSFSPPRPMRGATGQSKGPGGAYDLDTTPYGRRYEDLLAMNQPAVLVV